MAKSMAIHLVLIFAVLLQLNSAFASDHEDKEIEVTILVDYDPPSTFQPESIDDYRAASAVTLTCLVNGVNEGLLYEWTSTCTGACFVRGGTAQSVGTRYLHSYDSGVHTCMVYDGLGCSGNASITMNVVGAGIYVSAGHQVLANNSLIVAGGDNRIGEFRCVSGSKRSHVGYLYNTDGIESTHSPSDPFLVVRGGAHSPGMLHVRSLSPLQPEDQGVYTCRIPDETGNMVSVHVGLYLYYTEPIRIQNLESDLEQLPVTVTCTSSLSPPTNLLWTYNGEDIAANDTQYTSTQLLVDRHNTVYENTLTIEGSFENAIGQYSCAVFNDYTYADSSISINALKITGHEQPIIVGLSETITCTTKLDISKMEWFLVGVDDPVESVTGSDTLLLPLEPKTTGLNGAMFTCRATTTSGHQYEETITIEVKELEHTVIIDGDEESTLLAGYTYRFTCFVETDITPTVKWMGPDGNPVIEGDGIVLDSPVVEYHLTILTMTFTPLRTSHGGIYSCLSVVDVPSSIRRTTTNITVRISSPSVTIVRTPNNTQLFTTSQLELTCITVVDPAVDTDISVIHAWRGPSGTLFSLLADSRIAVGGVTGNGLEFHSSVDFSYLKSSDTGTYTCTSNVNPSVDSLNVVSSYESSATTSVNAALKVTIQITYTPPDQYPDYEPPNYRVASSVTLQCVVEGATGSVSYQWSSTCSSCFASSSSSSTVSESFLRSRDGGVHTCTVTDSSGNSGSGSTQMNLVGAGIYVTKGLETVEQYVQPNNTYIRTNRYYYRRSRYEYTRMSLYCCSNSTSYIYDGSITGPQGTYTSNFWRFRLTQGQGGSYLGCIFLDVYYGSSYFYLNDYNGMYTCNIPDVNGTTQQVNFGVYDESFSSAPTITEFSRATSQDSSLTLNCTSTTSPPTNITWYRDGVPLNVDCNAIRMRQRVTSRSSSTYENTLLISDNPNDMVGEYNCTVGNRFGNSTSTSVSITGIQLTEAENLTVGSPAIFQCSSDLEVLEIQWFRDNTLVFSSQGNETEVTFDPIATNDHGVNYTCRVSSPYGTQERSVLFDVTVLDEWATVVITNSTNENALHESNYTLICTVRAVDGMTLAPTVEWFYLNGSVIVSGGDIAIGDPQTEGTITTSTLSFSPVFSEDGGVYTCKASVHVPWMTVQPPSHSATVNMVVITQAMFQLRMEPVKYCIEWNLEEAIAFDAWVKQNIERAVRQRCGCDFRSVSAVYSGEFGCRTSKTSVLYRAIINGTSDLHTADELMDFIEDWRTNEGTLLNNKFRLNLANKTECDLRITSFNDEECGTVDAPEPKVVDIRPPKQPLLTPDTCYTFHECGEDGSGV